MNIIKHKKIFSFCSIILIMGNGKLKRNLLPKIEIKQSSSRVVFFVLAILFGIYLMCSLVGLTEQLLGINKQISTTIDDDGVIHENNT
jgi:hypothetical protein